MYEFKTVDLMDETGSRQTANHLSGLGLDVEQLLLAGIRRISFSKEFGDDLRMDFFWLLWRANRERRKDSYCTERWLIERDQEFTSVDEKLILNAYKFHAKREGEESTHRGGKNCIHTRAANLLKNTGQD